MRRRHLLNCVEKPANCEVLPIQTRAPHDCKSWCPRFESGSRHSLENPDGIEVFFFSERLGGGLDWVPDWALDSQSPLKRAAESQCRAAVRNEDQTISGRVRPAPRPASRSSPMSRPPGGSSPARTRSRLTTWAPRSSPSSLPSDAHHPIVHRAAAGSAPVPPSLGSHPAAVNEKARET